MDTEIPNLLPSMSRCAGHFNLVIFNFMRCWWRRQYGIIIRNGFEQRALHSVNDGSGSAQSLTKNAIAKRITVPEDFLNVNGIVLHP